MSRGDVCWLELPEEGRRPVCVLTRREAIPVLRNVLVALVTRTVRDIPTEVRLTEDDGMAFACAISLDNVRTVPHALLTERITSLSGARMHEVCVALAAATGCD
ncbi:MAG: type II toxin-antitoxin system PemK/MazF family toxin [Solirubrobacteraceae bacterium MAG38_C4-C5]|nr:type II toxin-antitoxin system PemK/MazF family toxin [Candidatus Siliceabacter maunaloa]